MFEVGFTEILLILGLALLVLGPEKLPGLAKKIGAWTGRARAMANQLRTQLEQEVTVDGFDKPAARRPADPVSPTPAAAATDSSAQPAAATDSADTSPADAAQSSQTPPSTQQAASPHTAADEGAAATLEPARPVSERLDAQTMVSGMEPEPPSAAAPPATAPADPGLDVHSMVSGMEPPAPEPATKPEA